MSNPEPSSAPSVGSPPEFAPRDQTSPQLTLRAVLTGMLLGAVLSLCNIYSGLKIGWGFNMSVTSVLLSWAIWRGFSVAFGARTWNLQENNINQTAASAAASISSAGLVAPIPALTILTGHRFSYAGLAVWTFAVSIVGVVVAIGLRRQLLVTDRLRFPNGIATAETLREIYATGKQAASRVLTLVVAAVVASGVKIVEIVLKLKPFGPNLRFALHPRAVAPTAATSITLRNLGFSFEPTLMMTAVGVIVGFRAAASLVLGSLIAWGVLAPTALDLGWISAPMRNRDGSWYGALLPWLLWPGVGIMVTSALTSLLFSWRSIAAALLPSRTRDGTNTATAGDDAGDVPRKWLLAALAVATVLAMVTQIAMFRIVAWGALLAVIATFVLALVAARVTGETGITPIGAMGKVTQLMFGLLFPGTAAANLMAANVTGGASSQAGDLLNDMKAGLILGATPWKQAVAQSFGIAAGALAGSAGYLILVPHPERQLLTAEWPAPAVAAWKAVAEIFMRGAHAMPPASVTALAIGGVVGVVLAVMEKTLPDRVRRFVPSPASLGLGFVIPAYNGVSMLLGATAGELLKRSRPQWASQFLIVTAAGAIAGESLTGVVDAIRRMFT